jgi:hypothetical protein
VQVGSDRYCDRSFSDDQPASAKRIAVGRLESARQKRYMKWRNGHTGRKSLTYFHLPLAMCFSREFSALPVFCISSISFLLILMGSEKRRALLPQFSQGSNQITELAEWS